MFGDGLQDLISDKGQSGIESNFIDLKVQLLNAINDGLDQRWESRFGDSQGYGSSSYEQNDNYDVINDDVYDPDDDSVVFETRCSNANIAGRFQHFPGSVEEGLAQEGTGVSKPHTQTRYPVPTVAVTKGPAAGGCLSGGLGPSAYLSHQQDLLGEGIIDVDNFAIGKKKKFTILQGNLQ